MDSKDLNTTNCSHMALSPLNQSTSISPRQLHLTTSCLFWQIVQTEKSLILLLLFTALLLFSVMVNSYLLFGLKSSDGLSWQPRYTLLKNLIVSDLLLSIALSSIVLRCLLTRHTLVFGGWCLVQFTVSTIGITGSLLTLALMVMERFIFVCHGLRYLLIMTSRRLRLAIALIWVVSGTIATVRVNLLLSGQTPFGRPIPNLLCEAGTMRGLPTKWFDCVSCCIVLLVCSLTFYISYGRMYQVACRAMEPFHSGNIRARHTISFYFFMFFLQLLPIMVNYGVILLVPRKTMSITVTGNLSIADYSIYSTAFNLLTVFMVPPCLNPLAYGIRNMEVRHALAQLFRLHQRRWGRCLRQSLQRV